MLGGRALTSYTVLGSCRLAGLSEPRCDTSLRARPWVRRAGVEEDDETCEKDGDVQCGAEVGGGAAWWEPCALRFLGEFT